MSFTRKLRSLIGTAALITATTFGMGCGMGGQLQNQAGVTGAKSGHKGNHLLVASGAGTHAYLMPLKRVKQFSSGVGAGDTLTYGGGALLTSVKIFNIFWGDYYSSGVGAAYATKLNNFAGYLVGSQTWISTVTQYNIGGGSFIGSVVITGAAPATIDDSAIPAQITAWKSAGTIPAGDSNTLFAIHLPPGTSSTMGTSDASCVTYCGYHNNTPSNEYYSIIPDESCGGQPGCNFASGSISGTDSSDDATVVYAHETTEASTDPVPGGGWYNQSAGEIGDICASQLYQEGGFVIQQEFSNSDNSCVPSSGTTGGGGGGGGGVTCNAPQVSCDGGMTCTDPTSDNNNCGTCGNVCASGTSCQSGSCQSNSGGGGNGGGPGSSCNTDNDCVNLNDYCISGICSDIGGYCQQDSDCDPSETCDPNNGCTAGGNLHAK